MALFGHAGVAERILEIANSVEEVQDGRIYIEKITGRFCSSRKARRPSRRPVWIWRSRAAG